MPRRAQTRALAVLGGVGVTTGAPKVYLVFRGSQWGTQGTDANGYTTLSGDPSGTAPVLQGFFKGLGTDGESWSGVMTQYCQGVASGSTTCPTGSAHVGYPTGGALAGVWVDTSAAAPAQATGNQIGTEAVKAAGHFGNTTATSNWRGRRRRRRDDRGGPRVRRDRHRPVPGRWLDRPHRPGERRQVRLDLLRPGCRPEHHAHHRQLCGAVDLGQRLQRRPGGCETSHPTVS